MHTRKVEVAVGLSDHTWRDIRVEVEEDPDHVLDDDELKEKAKVMAKRVFSSKEVSFLVVIYIEPLDYMEGLL